MLLGLTPKKTLALKISIEKETETRKWKRLGAVVTDDGFFFFPAINVSEGRLVFIQPYIAFWEIDVEILGLDVADEKAVEVFLEIVKEKLPRAKTPDLGEFLRQSFTKAKELFDEICNNQVGVTAS